MLSTDPATPEPLNAFTVDLEDYYHAHAAGIPRDRWSTCTPRAEIGTRLLLDLLEKHRVRATFFIVGELAERQPALVAEVARRGHEIGYHTYAHQRLAEFTPENFRADLRRGRALLREKTGADVRGFRAPSWSLTDETRWALPILKEEGFTYDASAIAIKRCWIVRGMPDAAPRPFAWENGPVEFPAPVLQLGPMRYPFGIATAVRLAPAGFTSWAARQFRARIGAPFQVAVHPSDFDPGQPRTARGPVNNFFCYSGLKNMARHVEALLRRFRFGSVMDVLSAQGLA